jgi:hypothetical protein
MFRRGKIDSHAPPSLRWGLETRILSGLVGLQSGRSAANSPLR